MQMSLTASICGTRRRLMRCILPQMSHAAVGILICTSTKFLYRMTLGDLHIDAHHTVEDSGVVLGTAMRMALGEMLGIRRYGYVCIPMDEVLILAAIDLCN